MGYRPVPFRDFGGGLNLRDGSDVVSEREAIDLLNVTFTERGAVTQRDGYGLFTAAVGTNRYDSLGAFYTAGGTKQVMAGAGNRLDAINNSGAVVASSTSPTASPHFFARFAAPGSEHMYIANGTDTVRKWDGASFSTPSYTGSTPTGRFLAVTPWDNRLVCARTVGQVSRLLFSDPGDPLTFGANNYIDLSPGDGEAIMGLAVWRELLFVFKETKLFVFTGTSTDTDGSPIFDYYGVQTGVGLASSRALAVGREGVYFLDRSGVYVTTGQQPQQVSDVIDPLFPGATLPDFYSQAGGVQLAGTYITNAAMCLHNERLYLGCTGGSATVNNRTLVFDPRYGWWSVWDLPAAALVSFRPSSSGELVFALASGTKDLARHSSAYTSDAGVAISSRWRSGWFDYDAQWEKTIREGVYWGSGACTLAISRDYADTSASDTLAFTNSTSDTWGDGTGSDTWGDGTGTDTWAALGPINRKMVRRAIRGTLFSVKFSNTTLNQGWSIHRAVLHLREARQPNVHTAS